MTRIKILNIDKATSIGVVSLQLGDDMIKLNLRCIPAGMSICEWIDYLEENGILLVYEDENNTAIVV